MLNTTVESSDTSNNNNNKMYVLMINDGHGGMVAWSIIYTSIIIMQM